MNFKQLRERMPALLSTGISLELVSAPGRGKSEFIRDTISIMSKGAKDPWGFSTLFLATQTPPDLIGYVFKGEREWSGKKVAISEPTLPAWMVTTEGKPVTEYERGILFLDEYGQGEADVKRASAELLLNKQLGPWKLPDGWTVIAASNRSSDRSGVTKSFDFVINRRQEIHISDDVASWTEWANTHDVSPLSIYFANEYPHIVFSEGVPKEQGPWCTPRTLVMNDKMLRAVSGNDGIPDDPESIELSTGLIGSAAATQFFVAVRLEREMPKYEKIVMAPDKAKVPDKPDARMLVCYNLAHRVTEEEAEPVIKYVERFPKEFAVTFAQAACRRKPALVATAAFSKWCMTNSSLMAAIAR
jgi:hypothetical protein